MKLKAIYNKLVKWLANIPNDKLLHFIAGMIVAAFFSIVIIETAVACVLYSAFVGAIKEAVDEWKKPGAWSYADLLATTFGGLVIQIMVWIS